MPKILIQAAILQNIHLSPSIKQMTIAAPLLAQTAQPGQFVHVKAAGHPEPLLRRPLSIAGVNREAGTLTLIYRIVGKGSAMLAGLKPGTDLLDCLGPLGQGFALRGEKPLLIGGGIGIAPLLFLAQCLCPLPAEIIIGGRTQGELTFWQPLFKDACQHIHITTDDGSLGVKGLTVDILPQMLDRKFDMIYACGPQPMLRAVAAIAGERRVPCQVSLEERMACGIGACLVCTCNAVSGSKKKVCSDGPVFWAEEIVL